MRRGCRIGGDDVGDWVIGVYIGERGYLNLRGTECWVSPTKYGKRVGGGLLSLDLGLCSL